MNRRALLLGATAFAMTACNGVTMPTYAQDAELIVSALTGLVPILPSVGVNATTVARAQDYLGVAQAAAKAIGAATSKQTAAPNVASFAKAVNALVGVAAGCRSRRPTASPCRGPSCCSRSSKPPSASLARRTRRRRR
jgi:hypothetical protein